MKVDRLASKNNPMFQSLAAGDPFWHEGDLWFKLRIRRGARMNAARLRDGHTLIFNSNVRVNPAEIEPIKAHPPKE